MDWPPLLDLPLLSPTDSWRKASPLLMTAGINVFDNGWMGENFMKISTTINNYKLMASQSSATFDWEIWNMTHLCIQPHDQLTYQKLTSK